MNDLGRAPQRPTWNRASRSNFCYKGVTSTPLVSPRRRDLRGCLQASGALFFSGSYRPMLTRGPTNTSRAPTKAIRYRTSNWLSVKMALREETVTNVPYIVSLA